MQNNEAFNSIIGWFCFLVDHMKYSIVAIFQDKSVLFDLFA